MDYRELSPGQSSRVMIAGIDGAPARVLFESDDILFEAPNWTVDGRALILNGQGLLWRLEVDTGELSQILVSDIPALNNDHVLHPDGESIFLSANDWHIYHAPLTGGAATRVTGGGDPRLHFLHGVSPDGQTLAYVGLEPEGDNLWARANIFTIPSSGGESTRLTDTTSPADGSEFSPDGEWIYFNTEQFSSAPGHAQIARMRADGSALEQLTHDAGVNWFPHISPDGATFVYLTFPSGTIGHPADLDIELKLVRNNDWAGAETIAALFGGQGTINVNSWAPTSDRFAYVEYPIS